MSAVTRLQKMLRALAAYAFRDQLSDATADGREVIIPPPSVKDLPLVHRYCVSSGAQGVFELSRVEVRKDPATGTIIKITYPALRVITGELIGPRDATI